jgi:hypothetical protein
MIHWNAFMTQLWMKCQVSSHQVLPWNLCGGGVSVLVVLVHEQLVCWWLLVHFCILHHTVDPIKNGKAELRPPIQPLSEFVNILINCQFKRDLNFQPQSRLSDALYLGNYHYLSYSNVILNICLSPIDN